MRTAGWLGIIAVVAVTGVLVGRQSGESTGGASSTRFDSALAAADPKAHLAVDLYKPPSNPTRTLVVFLQGNDPGEPDERAAFAAEVGEAFQRRGIDVAAVSFQVGPESPLRPSASAVAKAIAEIDRSGSFQRIVLSGRGVGAWAASMLALDRRFFEGTGFDATRLTGVITMHSTFDMSEAEDSASPFARADAPPFLLLSAGNDEPRFPRLDRRFAQSLQKAGAKVERHVVPFRDQHSLTHWVGAENDLGELVFGFVDKGITPLQPDSGVLEMQQRWEEHPPLDESDFTGDPSKIQVFPVDAALRKTLDLLFKPYPYILNTLPGKTFDAIDLGKWLASRPESEVGKGDYLVVSNLRDEKLYYTRAQIEALKPVIVLALDDETNLNKLFVYYRLRQAYSWKKGEEPMPLMIRPLGAFLHFPTEPPPELVNRIYAPFALTAKSFHWQETDPLAAVRDLSATLQPTMVGDQGCLKCHLFRGAGSRSHHMLASTGASYGAFALPLEEYPPGVLKRFLFDQDTVAKGFDVSPLKVDKPIAEELLALVSQARAHYPH